MELFSAVGVKQEHEVYVGGSSITPCAQQRR